MRDSENVLLSHLTETASLDILAAEGFGTDSACVVLSAEVSRAIVQWALGLYFESGRETPITKMMIEATWGEEMEQLGLAVDDEHELEPIEWAIDDLRSAYAQMMAQNFATSFVREIAEAHGPDRVGVVVAQAQELFALSRSLVSRRQEADAATGLEMAVARYHERVQDGREVTGLAFGMRSIDLYTKGVHDGELCVFAAPSAAGKSWVALKTAYEEWRRGRKTVLVTLENSLDMTFDRLACLGAHVSYERWQVGKCTEEEVGRVMELQRRIEGSQHRPLVVMPSSGERTMTTMVRKALTERADSLIIDQLSFVEPSEAGAKLRNRWAAFGEMMHELKEAISEGREKIPCLLLHQINRKGVEEASKTGHFVMEHLAESSEIERTSDFVFAVYRSDFDKQNGLATWQTLKVRRVPPGRDFEMLWELDKGHIAVRGDQDLALV